MYLVYLGMTFYENSVSINVRDGTLALNGNRVQCELESELPSMFCVAIGANITIPPYSEVIVQGKLKTNSINLTQAIVEPTDSQLANREILVAKSLVNVKTGELPLRLANVSNDPQRAYTGTLAARCEPVNVIENDIVSDLKRIVIEANQETVFRNTVAWLPLLRAQNLSLVILKNYLNRQKLCCLRLKLSDWAFYLQRMRTLSKNTREILDAAA